MNKGNKKKIYIYIYIYIMSGTSAMQSILSGTQCTLPHNN